MTWNQKFSTNSAGEGLQSHQLRLNSLFSIYSGSNKICKWHVCSSVFKGAKITPSIVTHTNIKEKSRNWPLQLQNIKILWKKLIESEKNNQNVKITPTILHLTLVQGAKTLHRNWNTPTSLKNYQFGLWNWETLNNIERN